MNGKDIFIPSFDKADKVLSVIYLFIATIACLFLGVFVTAIFLFLEYFFGFEYFGVISPFTTEYALIFWLICLIYSTVKSLTKLITLYYVDENGDTVKCKININNIENTEDLISGETIGVFIDKIIGHGSTGLTGIRGLEKIILGVSLNTNKDFVLNNFNNKDVYIVKKIYKKSENFKIESLYENVDMIHVPTVLKWRTIISSLFKYIFAIISIVFAVNVIFTAIAISKNTDIKNMYSGVQQDLNKNLYPFGYKDISTKQIKFKRQNYNIDSTISLDYNHTGKLMSTDINIYWDYSEKSDYILSEIKTIYNILGINFNESIYKEKIEELKSPKKSGYSEKTEKYKMYLTPSSGKINLKIY